jgi:membrane-bound serine protease (ClpP class)
MARYVLSMGAELTILVLLILGLAFMLLEAIVPAFGLLGLGGALSFMAALIMLYDLDSFYGLRVDGPLLTALGILGLAILAGSFYFIRVAWKSRVSAGAEAMIGARGKVLEWTGVSGRVHVDGESWAAKGPENLAAGDIIRVSGRDHLILTVIKGA